MNTQRPRLEEDSMIVRAVLDSMGEGLITIDAEGMITAVNPYAQKALGYEENELLGKWFSGTIIAVNENRQPIENFSRPAVRALTTGEVVSEPTYYLRKDGSMIPVFLTVSPILINGRPGGVIELFRDMTADEQLNIAKDDFVSLASHQLRTPASGVQAILSMVLDEDFGPLTPQQRVQLQKAMLANQRQLHIIEDILNTARVDSGKLELDLARVDLASLISEALTEQESQFSGRNQEASFKAEPCPPIWADRSKLRMVLDNLLSNASKYTPTGGQITVSLGTDSQSVQIVVSDNGIGIPAEDLPRLFSKFTRLDNEFSTLVGGSGLGLYIANNIVALHNGSLSVTSRPGLGTSFCVSLPIQLG